MQKSLAKNAIYNMLYRILNVLFPLVTAAYVARVLEPAGVGKVDYARNIVSYFVMFAVLGIPRYGTREIAKVRHDPRAVNKLFTELLVINFASTLICVIGYYTAVISGLIGDSIIYVICGIEIMFNFINIDWFYEGEEEYVYITVRSILIKLLSITALFSFVKDANDYPIYALITCLGLGMNYLFNVYHARNRVKLTFHNLEIRKHLKPIMILMISVVAASLYNKVNVTMLGVMCDEEIVAYYSNSSKIVTMLLTLVTAISGVFMPRLSYMYAHDRTKFSNLVTLGAKIVLFFAIPCCAGLFVVAQNAVYVLFDVQFLPAVPAMRIMSVLIVIIGVCDLLCYQTIISSGNEKKLIYSRVVAGIANVILNALLIPRFQHVGTAVATVISELIVNGMLIKYAFEVAQPDIPARYIIKLLLGATIMSTCVWCLQRYITNPVVALIGSVCLGVALYIAAEAIMKNEVLIMLKTMRSRKMNDSHS